MDPHDNRSASSRKGGGTTIRGASKGRGREGKKALIVHREKEGLGPRVEFSHNWASVPYIPGDTVLSYFWERGEKRRENETGVFPRKYCAKSFL